MSSGTSSTTGSISPSRVEFHIENPSTCPLPGEAIHTNDAAKTVFDLRPPMPSPSMKDHTATPRTLTIKSVGSSSNEANHTISFRSIPQHSAGGEASFGIGSNEEEDEEQAGEVSFGIGSNEDVEQAQAGEVSFEIDPHEDLEEESLAFTTDKITIHANENHYVDPISGKVFSIQYGNKVKPQDWEKCTRSLITAVTMEIHNFLGADKLHVNDLQKSVGGIESYTFDWESGLITLKTKSGVLYQLEAGESLHKAINPYLTVKVQPKEFAKIADGLQGIQPPLEPSTLSFLMYINADPLLSDKLRAAIKNKKTTHKEKEQYSVILDLLATLRTKGIITSLDKKKRDLINPLLSDATATISSKILGTKVVEGGKEWLQDYVISFETRLKELTQIPVCKKSIDINLEAQINSFDMTSADLADHIRNLRGHSSASIEVTINARPNAFQGSFSALQERALLHLEPSINLARAGEPSNIVDVSQVTCLMSSGNSKQKEAEYIHFVRSGDEWWKMDGASCSQVNWSDVQQAASLHASKVSFSSRAGTPKLVDLVTADREAESSKTVKVIDMGSVFDTEGLERLDWSDASLNPTYEEMVSNLRQDQAKMFNARSSLGSYIDKLYLPIIEAECKKHPEYITTSPGKKDLNVYSEVGKQAFERLFTELSPNNPHRYIPVTAFCFDEIQHMANINDTPILVLTGTGKTDCIIFTPDNKPLTEADKTKLVCFASPALSSDDKFARAVLTPINLPGEIIDQSLKKNDERIVDLEAKEAKKVAAADQKKAAEEAKKMAAEKKQAEKAKAETPQETTRVQDRGGIENPANACYAISAIQTLRFNPTLRELITRELPKQDSQGEPISEEIYQKRTHLQSKLREMLQSLDKGETVKEKTLKDFFTILRDPQLIGPDCSWETQHDSTTFWRHLTRCLQINTDINEEGRGSPSSRLVQYSYLSNQTRSQTTNVSLILKPDTEENQGQLVVKDKNITDVLKHRGVVFESTPALLSITMNRFEIQTDNSLKKIKGSIGLSEKLDLTEFLAPDKEGLSPQYELSTIVNHIGNSTTSGHYVTYQRLDSGGWIRCSDASVTKLPQNFDPSSIEGSYMIFYKRVDAKQEETVS